MGVGAPEPELLQLVLEDISCVYRTTMIMLCISHPPKSYIRLLLMSFALHSASLLLHHLPIKSPSSSSVQQLEIDLLPLADGLSWSSSGSAL
jgi:hypothetical protein